MSDPATTAASRRSTYIVGFFPQKLFVCDAASPTTVRGRVYLPDPNLELKFPELGGGLAEKPLKLRGLTRTPISAFAALLQAFSDMRSVPPTTVYVDELQVAANGDSSVVHRFIGTIDIGRRNSDETPGLVELEIHPLTATLDHVLGRPTTAECDAAYGSRLCGIAITPYPGIGTDPNARYIHQVRMSFAQRGVTVQLNEDSGLNEGLLSSIDKWSRGFVREAALNHRILIREYRPLTRTFILAQRPPADWQYATASKVLELWPGCLKTPAACDERLNTSNFGGLGLGTPAYNPAYEEDGR